MASRKDQVPTGSFLPLSPPEFHVLLALADGPKHGYAVMKDVSQRTENKVRLSAGTLYGIVARLLSQGLIAETRLRPEPALDDERRRYYELTTLGREIAIAETERMEEAIALARSKHLFAKPRTA